MIKKIRFKSIYAKFAMIFLLTWWILNSLTFGVVFRVISNSGITVNMPYTTEVLNEFIRIKNLTFITFLASALIGTVIILIVVRGIVRPIQKLSEASREIAKGNFEVELSTPKCLDEIGQLTLDFNVMVAELKSTDQLRKDFVSNVSHEFRTPITSIKGFAKLIIDDGHSDDKCREYAGIIMDESERLMNLSSNLLRLSELESKIIREEKTKFSLDEQIRKTILILEPQWTRKNVEFELELEKADYYGEESLLQQVWLNLIQNAIKFSEVNGLIRIKISTLREKIKVEIIDYGIGISEGDAEHIFERFYKGDKSRSGDGNGLGLVIVKKIIDISGGKIWVESSSGNGAKFIIEL